MLDPDLNRSVDARLGEGLGHHLGHHRLVVRVNELECRDAAGKARLGSRAPSRPSELPYRTVPSASTSVIASDEFCTIARNSSSLDRSCASTSSFSSTIRLANAWLVCASDSLISLELVGALGAVR